VNIISYDTLRFPALYTILWQTPNDLGHNILTYSIFPTRQLPTSTAIHLKLCMI
jgi:hypothetical protein